MPGGRRGEEEGEEGEEEEEEEIETRGKTTRCCPNRGDLIAR